MTFTLKILQDTFIKLQPIESSQLPVNQIYKVTVTAKPIPVISWANAANNHISFNVTEKDIYYAYIPHVSLTDESGVDVLNRVTQSQANYIFETDTDAVILNDLNNCLVKFDITNKEDIRMFLAQCAHESGGLRYLEELASGDDYEWRTDLGNTQTGDGRKYKGCGLIQLTGRANYQAFADFMSDQEIVNKGCSYVAAKYPCSSAAFWWRNNDMTNYIVNQGATIEQVSTRVNGANPANGLSERIRYYGRAKDVIKDA
jgi:predicted chitinase